LKSGDPIPRIKYTEKEVKTWNHVYNKIKATHTYAASEMYRRNFDEMEKLGLIGENFIP